MWSVDHSQDLGQIWSLGWVLLEHAINQADQLWREVQLCHQLELLSDLLFVEVQGLHIVEVSDRVVACSAEGGDTDRENLVFLGSLVLDSIVRERRVETVSLDIRVLFSDLVILEQALDATSHSAV